MGCMVSTGIECLCEGNANDETSLRVRFGIIHYSLVIATVLWLRVRPIFGSMKLGIRNSL